LAGGRPPEQLLIQEQEVIDGNIRYTRKPAPCVGAVGEGVAIRRAMAGHMASALIALWLVHTLTGSGARLCLLVRMICAVI